MSANHEDYLPHSRGVAELVRRIVFRLNGNLAFAGHKPLSLEEHSIMFDLGEASKILDRIAVLPRMAQHEERTRRDLLEIFDLFNPREWRSAAGVEVIGVDLAAGDDESVSVCSQDGTDNADYRAMLSREWHRADRQIDPWTPAEWERDCRFRNGPPRAHSLTPTPSHVPPMTILELEDDDQEDDE